MCLSVFTFPCLPLHPTCINYTVLPCSILPNLNLFGSFLSRLVHVDIPEDARTASTRFRWWQPQHSGPELDQWALDEIVIARYENMKQLEDDFEQKTVKISIYVTKFFTKTKMGVR